MCCDPLRRRFFSVSTCVANVRPSLARLRFRPSPDAHALERSPWLSHRPSWFRYAQRPSELRAWPLTRFRGVIPWIIDMAWLSFPGSKMPQRSDRDGLELIEHGVRENSKYPVAKVSMATRRASDRVFLVVAADHGRQCLVCSSPCESELSLSVRIGAALKVTLGGSAFVRAMGKSGSWAFL